MLTIEPTFAIRKIIVPIDYSAFSTQACIFAMHIAKQANAEITILHTFYSPAFDLIELSGKKASQDKLKEEVTKELIAQEQKTMDSFISTINLLPEYKQIGEQNIKTEIIPGQAKQTINEFCTNHIPDLVVMGTHGKTAEQTSIVGSITEHAIKRLSFPVLAIPSIHTPNSNINLNRILYLTDYDESDFLSIKKLMGFANVLNLSIHCLHIGAKTGNWEKMKMDGLKTYFKTVYDTINVECDILPADSNRIGLIEQYVLDNNIDIISLTNRKRNLIEKYVKPSLTRKLFYNLNKPLLVFHS